jgi:putative flippase GtrA
MWQPTTRQAISFGAIGAVGFIVDGGILTLLNSVLAINLLSSRLCSFSIAVTVTWLLNRKLTFPDRKDKRAMHEWLRYAALNGLGALLNLVIFFWLIFVFKAFATVPLVPLAIAAVVALVFNFLVSRYFVFRGSQT